MLSVECVPAKGAKGWRSKFCSSSLRPAPHLDDNSLSSSNLFVSAMLSHWLCHFLVEFPARLCPSCSCPHSSFFQTPLWPFLISHPSSQIIIIPWNLLPLRSSYLVLEYSFLSLFSAIFPGMHLFSTETFLSTFLKEVGVRCIPRNCYWHWHLLSCAVTSFDRTLWTQAVPHSSSLCYLYSGEDLTHDRGLINVFSISPDGIRWLLNSEASWVIVIKTQRELHIIPVCSF